jgi:hypothetical protein
MLPEGRYLPTLPEISRETLAVVAGAILAAVIFSQLPALRRWVADRLPTSSR